MIEVRNLTKKYGNHLAVDNLSFTIENGRVYGLLGPNGAGKSTTMNIITGCLAATSGTVLVDGHDIFEDPIAAKKQIGYLPEIPPLYTDMTPYEYLTFVSEAKGVPFDKRIPEIRSIMKLTGIEDRADKLIRSLSKGYKQRVGIAQAMIGDPDTIILDEPTVGLDPQQIIEIRKLIAMLAEHKTVVISSHILAEISAVCDRVIIISRGKLVADDSLEALESRASRDNGLSVSAKTNIAAFRRVLDGIEGVEYGDVTEKNGTVSAVLSSAEGAGNDLTDRVFFAFARAGMALSEMVYRESSLESIFLGLTSAAAEAPEEAGVSLPTEDAESRAETAEDQEDDYKPLFGGSSEEDDR